MKEKNFHSDKILNYCQENNIKNIAFDFFDTVAYRRVPPEYVKYIAAKRFLLKSGINISPQLFYELRSGFEIKLSQSNNRKYGSLEFNIEELAKYLADYFEGRSQLNKDRMISDFIETEIQVELEVLCLNEDIFSFMKLACSQGINLYLISDFYIPRNLFDKIIKKLGLTQLFKQIFISTDFRKTKRSGDLYKEFLAITGLDSKEIIMIGNSLVSDVEMAEENGIKSYLIDSSKRENQYQSKFLEIKDFYLSNNNIENSFKKIFRKHKKGLFPEMAAIILFFTEQLYLKVVRENYQEVFFCSKEGYFLKKAFDYYQKEFIGREVIKTHYIKVSRRSTFLPSLTKLDKEKFETIFRQYVNLSLNQFIKNFNFELEENEKILSKYSNPNEEIKNFPHSQEFQELKRDIYFRELFEKKRLEQKKLIKKYIIQKSIFKNPKEIMLVDVGWKGTIQDHLFKIFDGKIKISGKYIGLNVYNNSQVDYILNSKEGIVFSNNPESKFYLQFNKMSSLFEIILSAPHGSAVRYFLTNKGVPEVKCEKILEEVRQYADETKEIQEELFICLKEMIEFWKYNHRFLESFFPLMTKFFVRIVYLPTKKELRYYKHIKHFENFALFNYSTFSRKEKFLSKKYIKKVFKLLSGFKWFFSQEWGAFCFSNYGLDLLGKILGRRFYNKFVKENKL